jgi:uridine kinase
MQSEAVRISIDGKSREYPKGTALYQIAGDYQPEMKEQGDIILAVVNNKLSELSRQIEKDCEVTFLTTADENGAKTYCRGVIFMMLRAAYQVLGRENVKKITVEHSIGSGIFCEYVSNDGSVLTEKQLAEIETRMHELVEEDIMIEKQVLSTDEAIALFHRHRMYDKEKLFNYRRVSTTNIYRMGDFEDYFYGYMPYRTGSLKYFSLSMYEDGFILQLPEKKHPGKVTSPQYRPKLFQVMREANSWGRMMKVSTVGELNEIAASGKFQELILVQEALQEKKIADIAEQIRCKGDKKFIMIAGPSSSGKTTFSHRLSIQLRANGMIPHPIALDNYFKNREDTPVDEDGNYNFECLEALDIEVFNKDMSALLNGETVELPTFDFMQGKREYKGNFLKLGADDILVLEGIHGLNDEMSYSLPRESKFKIYISPMTQVNIDEHDRIPTTDARLIRRMVRDSRTRGTQAKDTIAMWPSVRRGEEEYIFPFQEEADSMFNSAAIYELAVLKQYVEPVLFGIDRNCPEYIEAKRLLKFLDYFIGVSADDIPKNSLVREFIGGSCFHV